MNLQKLEINKLEEACSGNQYTHDLTWVKHNKADDSYIARNITIENALRINEYRYDH